MAIIHRKPTTPGERFRIQHKADVENVRPVRSLTKSLHRAKGRNCYGRITSRRRGGGHKRLYRVIDFQRAKLDIPSVVENLQYDPNRSANIALIKYEDNTLAYILAPNGLKKGDKVFTTEKPQEEFPVGLCLPLKNIPPATSIHAIEMQAGRGAQLVRSAGTAARLINIEGNYATIEMPSGEIRLINKECKATIGTVGNGEHSNEKLGKAGRNRWKGKRPRVRGVAMNPVDHPMGGGEGKTSGGGHPVSPWGKLAKGCPTRKRAKTTNSLIVVRRNGKKFKR